MPRGRGPTKRQPIIRLAALGAALLAVVPALGSSAAPAAQAGSCRGFVSTDGAWDRTAQPAYRHGAAGTTSYAVLSSGFGVDATNGTEVVDTADGCIWRSI